MTVKELLQQNRVSYDNLTDETAQMPIHLFVSIWEHMDNELKSQLEPVAFICRTRLAQDEREVRQMQVIDEEQRKLEEKNNHNWRAENGAKRKLPVYTDEQLTSEHIAQMQSRIPDWNHPTLSWPLYAHLEIIPENFEGEWKSNSYTRLSSLLFKDGKSSFREILETAPKVVARTKGLNKKSSQILSTWQDIIIDYIIKHPIQSASSSRNEMETDQKPQPIFNISEHVCANLDLRIIIGDTAPYSQIMGSSRLLNALIKNGCYTIEDMFDYPELLLKKELGKQTYLKLVHLKEDIRDHTDEYDYITRQNAEQDKVVEYPILSDDQQGMSIMDKIAKAIQQLCEHLEMINPDKAHTVQQVFLRNKTYAEAAAILSSENNLSRESRRLYVQEFVDKMMSGSNNPVIANHYVSNELINTIQEKTQSCIYVPVSKLCEEFGIDNIDPFTQILKYLFEIDILHYSSEESTPFLSLSTDYAVPNDQVGEMSKDIKAIYDFMRPQIEPITAEEIYDAVHEENPQSAFYANTKAFEIFINTYEFFDHFDSKPTRYRLKLPKLKNWPYRIAAIIYDNKDTALSIDQIKQLYEQRTKQSYDYRSQVSNNLFQQNIGLAKKIVKKEQGWVYCEDTRPVISSLYTFIHDYIVKNETFSLKELKEYLLQNYEQTYKDESLMRYIYRYCVQAIDHSGIYCYSEAVDRHTEHQWRSRFDSRAVHENVCLLHEFLQNRSSSGSPYKTVVRLKAMLADFQKEKGYNYGIENLIRRFATVDTTNATLPFILIYDNNQRKLGINKLAEPNINWETIGLKRSLPFIGIVKARVVQTLRAAKNLTCEREDLYLACKPLLEETGRNSTSIIHEILYHHLSDVVEWWSEGNKAFFHLLKIEEEVHEAPVEEMPAEKAPTISTKQVLPLNSRPEPNREDFTRELTKVMQSYRAYWPWSMEESIGEFVEYLWNAPSKRIREQLRQYWYEFLVYKVDKYVVQSIYSESLSVYEKYLRLLNEVFSGEKINGVYGLGGTVNSIAIMDDFNRYNSGKMRDIYESLYRNRNKLDHGEDLPQEVNIYIATRDALALYVYTYSLMEKSY